MRALWLNLFDSDTSTSMKKKVARDRAKKARQAWAEKYEGTEKAKEWRRLAAWNTNAKRYGIMSKNGQED